MMFHPKGPAFVELVRQALSSTERGYDLLAPKFDYTPFRTPDWLITAAIQLVARHAPFDAVLDVCCGTGAAMQLLRPLCRRRLVGIDMSAGMLRVARQRLGGAAGGPDIELVQGDVLQMPFVQQFDLAVCFGALGHILPADQPRFVGQIARALRPGGRLLFVTSTMPPVWSWTYWFCRVFNALMHLRNWLVRPPFVMYYLTFTWPCAERLLRSHGFAVEVAAPLDKPFERLWGVVARREARVGGQTAAGSNRKASGHQAPCGSP